MKILFMSVSTFVMLVSFSVAQEGFDPPAQSESFSSTLDISFVQLPEVPNPFDVDPNQGSGMGSYGGMGEETMGGEMAAGEGMDGGGGMEMGGGMDMRGGMDMGGMGSMMGGASGGMAGEDLFRYRLQVAISRIRSAKSDDERATLMRYTQSALEDHYDQMIARRKRDLERLKESFAKLESDLQKREAARDRVVKLQMQSAVLAAEGLLDLNSLQPTSPEMVGGYGDGMGGMPSR